MFTVNPLSTHYKHIRYFSCSEGDTSAEQLRANFVFDHFLSTNTFSLHPHKIRTTTIAFNGWINKWTNAVSVRCVYIQLIWQTVNEKREKFSISFGHRTVLTDGLWSAFVYEWKTNATRQPESESREKSISPWELLLMKYAFSGACERLDIFSSTIFDCTALRAIWNTQLVVRNQ